MPNGTVVASLDVVVLILEDPYWNKKARKVKTLKEMRQLILDFCMSNGRAVKTKGEILCT